MSRYEDFLLRGEALPAANALIVPAFESSSEWTGVWAHEYFHFLQFTGTRMGHLLGWMYAFAGHGAGAFLREPPPRMREAPVWRFPIARWCVVEHDEELRRCLQAHFAHLVWQVETLNLILGFLPAGTTDNTWRDPHLWPWRTLPPKHKVYPEASISASLPRKQIGVLDLIETAAGIQGLRMEDADAGLPDGNFGFAMTPKQHQRLFALPPRYSVALRYTEQRTQIPPLYHAAATVLAVDIALSVGIDELNEATPSEPLAWEEWYPGWRFTRALTAIEELLGEGNWPKNESELSSYVVEIESRCGWKPDRKPGVPLLVFEEQPSASDTVRRRLAEEAADLREKRRSLWSVGSREQIVEASTQWFKPPILMHYGKGTIVVVRPELGDAAIRELWDDAELHHLAWQVVGDVNLERSPIGIECFYWAKEGSGRGCESFDGHCRWFPPANGGLLPKDCPMARRLKRIAGAYWTRLKPLSELRDSSA